MIGYFILVSVIQVLVFSGLSNSQQNETDKVDVEIYYETLCPNARSFIVDQLSPFLKTDLSHYINLTLIPYGIATTVQKSGNHYEFSCDHGEAECYGNKLQGCALVLLNIGSNTTNLGFNKEAVEFIVCLMKDLNPKSSIAEVQTASDKCKVTEEHNILTTCANTTLGSQYLAHLGNETNHFQNPLGNVPTIVFNKVYRKNENDLAKENFMEQFCSKLKLKNLTACTAAVEASIGPTILPIPQLSLGITIFAFFVIHLFYSY